MIRLACLVLAALLAACASRAPDAATSASKPAPRPLAEHSDDYLYLAAQQAIADGNYKLAVRMLGELVRRHPDDIEPARQLIELELGTGQLVRARGEIERLLANPRLEKSARIELKLALARIEAKEGNPEQAERLLGEIIEAEPGHAEAVHELARLMLARGETDRALALIRRARRINKDARLALLEAELLARTGQSKSALALLEKAARENPDDARPLLMRVDLLVALKREDEAERALRAFLDRHPDALEVANRLGRLLVSQHRDAEAILIYRDLATRTGGAAPVLEALGLLYFQHGDHAEAERVFRKLIRSRPTDTNRFYLAASLEAQGREEEAARLYREIGKDSRMYPDAQIRLAGIDYSAGRLSRAARRLAEVIRMRPRMAEAYALLSGVRLARKEYRRLLSETEPALALPKLPPILLINRAAAYEHFKEYDGVERELKRLLHHDPRNAEALNFLGYAYAEQCIKLDEAERLIRRALELKPDDGYYLDSLAWVRYCQGRFDEALAIQRRAMSRVADDPVMHEHLGDILWRKGDTDAARKAWRQALKLKHPEPARIRERLRHGLSPAR